MRSGPTASDGRAPSRLTVLFVDQGVSFGGSLVVAANLARALDPQRVRCIVAAEADWKFLRHQFPSTAELRQIRHGVNYQHWARVDAMASRLPTVPLQKLLRYSLAIVQLAINSAYISRLLWLVLRERVDLIHLNNGVGNPEAFLVTLLTRRPFVVHVHGVDEMSFLPRYFLRRSRHLVSISESVTAALLANGVVADKVRTIPNPVRVEPRPASARTEMRARFGWPDDAPVVGIVGRIVRWKGQLEFLRAAREALGRVPRARVALVGDSADGYGGYMAEVRSLVEESGLGDRVTFTGFVEDVASIYTALDVVVHASIDPEPFGLVITEAMSQGVPVIASSLGAPREIITDGRTGFLVDPRDTTLLAQRIERLLVDPAERRRIGEAGREHVLRTYDLSKYAAEFEAVYRTAAASPP
jgi:glycosyltransferase involved in cell wall biosynthesis